MQRIYVAAKYVYILRMCSISAKFKRPKIMELERVTPTRNPEIDLLNEAATASENGDSIAAAAGIAPYCVPDGVGSGSVAVQGAAAVALALSEAFWPITRQKMNVSWTNLLQIKALIQDTRTRPI